MSHGLSRLVVIPYTFFLFNYNFKVSEIAALSIAKTLYSLSESQNPYIMLKYRYGHYDDTYVDQPTTYTTA